MKINQTQVFFFNRKKLLLNIMKTFVFLCVTTVLSFSPKNVFSQEVKININEDKTLSVDEVFDLIVDQTKYKFIYQEGLFNGYSKINLKKGKIRVNDLMSNSFSKGKFNFSFSGENIVIIKEKSTLEKEAKTQQRITGKVVTEENVPLLGVTVLVKGGKKGVVTDFDGNYSLAADEGDVLSFSYVGYVAAEVTVAKQTQINVTLKEDLTVLNEVVVMSTGYQTISEERATGAFETISKEQLEKPASSISERLVGMVAGMQSTVSANGSISFEIRGQSSLLSDRQPLIVYDGFPIEGGLNSINPNDVESITVLKDAAAASIWGAKSANGVIVVTSKKAKQGKARISFSTFVKTSNKLDLDYVVGNASSAEVIEYEQMGFDSNRFGTVFGPMPGADVFSVEDPTSQSMIAMNEARLGRITPAQRDATLARLRGLNNKRQIEDHLLQAPITKQYNLSISGGSERMKNNLSLLFENNKDFFIGNKTDKYLINYSNKINIAKNLDFDFSGMMQYNNHKNNGTTLGTIKSLSPFDMLVNNDGSPTDLTHLKYYTPNLDAFIPKEQFPYSDWSYNPITEVRNRDFSTKNMNSRVQAGLTLQLIKGLTLSSKLQYEIFKRNSENYYGEKSFSVRQFINETSGWNYSNDAPIQNVPSGGILRQNESTVNSYNFRNQLNFNRTFLDKHAVNFVAGTEMVNRVSKYTLRPDVFGYNDQKLSTGELLNPINGSKMWNGYPLRYSQYFHSFRMAPTHRFAESTDRFFSMYGNLAYTYDDKYTLSGSYRTDASNLITDDPKFRYNPFWSVGLSWQVGREKFLENVNWLDKLNLRSTYGVNGNVDTSTSFKPLIAVNPSLNVFTQENTASISSYGNPTLRWEKTKTLNIGADFSLFNRKLFGSIDVYNKESFDLIISQSIASVNGTRSQRFNNGNMLNKGYELTLGTRMPIKGNDIVWSGSLNYAHNNNEITKLFKTNYQSYDLTDGGTTAYVEGNNANTLWAYQYAGMLNVGTDANPVLKPSVVGGDGDPITLLRFPTGNAVDYMVSQGTLVAPTTVGFRNSFKIHDFDLSFIVTGKFGHKFRRQSFNYPSLTGDNNPVNKKYAEIVNANPEEMIPIPGQEPRYYFYFRFYPHMSYLTQDASHIRFQEINLSYSLPNKITSKLGVNALNFYTQVNNVGVIFFNDFDEDPEYPVGTIRPQSTLTFGMNINF